ncbi:hypothetical protein [Paenibacillus donghaensis]|uniref:DUF4430 domain-containing protein n=1 Tax=Paenibacillus donghaensis TaxID=414771 RepID=A0A2Z2KL20_9BACL|nr:hypothetical protein [Paenibacillus donghaensis]ASA24090.1 hypothetical protein B9T62_26890 [Paenibacillus donghaensis]
MGKNIRGTLSNFCMISMLLLSACGSSNGDGLYAEYKGVKYTGEGSLVSKVAVAIQNEEGILFIQEIKVIDDQPTVWKVLQPISEDEDLGMPIVKNEQGGIKKISTMESDELHSWELFIDNVKVDGDVSDIEVVDEQAITLNYAAKS